MIQRGGLWWPTRKGTSGIFRDAVHIDEFLNNVPRKRVTVQAGGCVGLYPIRIAKQFGLVHTFEPHPETFECLELNTKDIANIILHRACLGDKPGLATMKIMRGVGSHQIDAEHAASKHQTPSRTIEVQQSTIDGLGLDECDLIWLDVEGYEIQVLDGAKETIRRFRPAVIIEKAGRGPSSIPWLRVHGYRQIMKINKDHMFLPC